MIISYCTHSGLRLTHQNPARLNDLRLYLIALRPYSVPMQSTPSRRLYLIARIADCDLMFSSPGYAVSIMIISYCTHSGLRLAKFVVSPCGIRLRLYLIARIADCDWDHRCDPEINQLRRLYLIARIADCDSLVQITHSRISKFQLIISYCTHSGLRR